jgi:hypothetical protein
MCCIDTLRINAYCLKNALNTIFEDFKLDFIDAGWNILVLVIDGKNKDMCSFGIVNYNIHWASYEQAQISNIEKIRETFALWLENIQNDTYIKYRCKELSDKIYHELLSRTHKYII